METEEQGEVKKTKISELEAILEEFGTAVLYNCRLRDLEKPISKTFVKTWIQNNLKQ